MEMHTGEDDVFAEVNRITRALHNAMERVVREQQQRQQFQQPAAQRLLEEKVRADISARETHVTQFLETMDRGRKYTPEDVMGAYAVAQSLEETNPIARTAIERLDPLVRDLSAVSEEEVPMPVLDGGTDPALARLSPEEAVALATQAELYGPKVAREQAMSAYENSENERMIAAQERETSEREHRNDAERAANDPDATETDRETAIDAARTHEANAQAAHDAGQEHEHNQQQEHRDINHALHEEAIDAANAAKPAFPKNVTEHVAASREKMVQQAQETQPGMEVSDPHAVPPTRKGATTARQALPPAAAVKPKSQVELSL